MSFSVVIPARFGSTRLPGKPLADIHGKPMIVRVLEQARKSSAEEIVIAADDEKIRAPVEAAGGQFMMTRTDHPSGSDRVMEVAEKRAWPDDRVVINVQGDEPLIPAAVIDQVANMLQQQTAIGVATLCHRIDDRADIFDPNLVKVVLGQMPGEAPDPRRRQEDDLDPSQPRGCSSRALYFSRAPIPWKRGDFETPDVTKPEYSGIWWQHIGIYGYRVSSLRTFVSLKPSELEMTESLEQLRLLENGIEIAVAPALETVSPGVDTPADLEKVRREFLQKRA